MTGAGGLGLAVQERGPEGAPTVLLVHGYPDDHAVWDLVADRLEADHHVVTYDVRGAGASGAPGDRNGYLMEALVEDLVAVTDAVSPGRQVHLVGHDWGSIQSWAAVTDPRVASRFASYTSMSGPSLDHVGTWIRTRLVPGQGHWGQLVGQGLHSWYVFAFHTPLAAPAWRHGLARRWPAMLARRENVAVDERWPSPALAEDAARGVSLYQANMARRAGRPRQVHTDVAVQLIVASDDDFVTPALLEGIEALASTFTRRDIEGGHWLPRSEPEQVARWVSEQVASLEAARNPAEWSDRRPPGPAGQGPPVP